MPTTPNVEALDRGQRQRCLLAAIDIMKGQRYVGETPGYEAPAIVLGHLYAKLKELEADVQAGAAPRSATL